VDLVNWVNAEHGYMLLSSNRSGNHELYLAVASPPGGPWQTPILLGSPNTADHEQQAWLSPDQLRLYYDVHASDGPADIMMATRETTDIMFSAGTPVVGLNSAASDRDAWLSIDEDYVVFSRGAEGAHDIYEAFLE
jgi:hypothetical protein